MARIRFPVGEADGQFPWGQIRLVERQVHKLVLHGVRDAVPDVRWLRGAVLEPLRTVFDGAIMPAGEGRVRDPDLGQGPADRKVGLLDDADDLELLGCRVSHSRSPPAPPVFS
jgi:hypothetical protein